MTDPVQTLMHPVEVLRSHAQERSKSPAYGMLSFGGQRFESFQLMTWEEAWDWVIAYAHALEKRGIGEGDHIALQGKNQVDWFMIDFALMSLGAVSIPLFSQVSLGERDYILKESEAKLFVSDQTQEVKTPILSFTELHQEARAYRGLAFNGKIMGLDTLATIIYTSGTTGEPKGVMHSYGNIAQAIQIGVPAFPMTSKERLISYLPLSHVAERMLSEFGALYAGATVYFVDQVERVAAYLPEVRPTSFLAVPRIWNVILNKLERELTQNPLVQKRLQSIPKFLRSWILPRMVKRKLGFQKTKHFFSGAAKLNVDVAKKMAEYGIRIREGYGLTETLCISALNLQKAEKLGSVGQIYPSVDIRFAEDGEICLKAPFHFLGYYKKEAETRAVMKDGWFHTGDIGRMNGGGYLYVTDRKKDLFKTSSGKYVAPQSIESELRAVDGINEAIVVGENQPYCVALISIQEGFPIPHFVGAVDRINRKLGPHERLKHVGLTPRVWGAETGELTPSMKLKRKVIENRYQDEIKELFQCRERVLFFGVQPPVEGKTDCAHTSL